MTTSTRRPGARRAIDRRTRERVEWDPTPVVEYLLSRYGPFDKHENPNGYCSAKVELLTRGQVHRTSWQRYVRAGRIPAVAADTIATRLGKHPRFFWPEYDTAIEPDNAFLAEWDRGSDGERAAARIRLAEHLAAVS